MTGEYYHTHRLTACSPSLFLFIQTFIYTNILLFTSAKSSSSLTNRLGIFRDRAPHDIQHT